MTGSDSIDISLESIWKSWWAYRKGKRFTEDLYEFQYHLEENLFDLYSVLNNGTYVHGGYHKFIISDNKRREIAVASIRDRIVHRLLYDQFVTIWDKTFIHDAWSCRKGKGLLGAIQRTQDFLQSYPRAYVWRADIKKFFDNVNHEILTNLILKRANSS